MSAKDELGPTDELQIRLLMRLPPAQRLRTMMELQALWLDTVRARLRRAYPHLSDYELTILMFERLQHGDLSPASCDL
jgi:hypothetical protein